jgi:hypothetical protein
MLGIDEVELPDLEKQQSKLLGILGVRVAFFLAILGITVAYQLKQTTFFNTESLFPVLGALFTSFVLNSIYLFFFDRLSRYWQPVAFLFGFDAIFITGIIFFTGV